MKTELDQAIEIFESINLRIVDLCDKGTEIKDKELNSSGETMMTLREERISIQGTIDILRKELELAREHIISLSN